MKKIAAIAALALSLTACSFEDRAEPVAEQPKPSTSATAEATQAPTLKATPKPKPIPVEVPAVPAEVPVVVPEVPVAPIPTVEVPPVHVAPADYVVDAPEYVEAAPVAPAPVAPVVPVEAVPVAPAPVEEWTGGTEYVADGDLDLGAMGFTQDPVTGAWIGPEYVNDPSEAAPLDEVVTAPVPAEGWTHNADGTHVWDENYVPDGTSVAETFVPPVGECESVGMVTREDLTCYVPGLSPIEFAPGYNG